METVLVSYPYLFYTDPDPVLNTDPDRRFPRPAKNVFSKLIKNSKSLTYFVRTVTYFDANTSQKYISKLSNDLLKLENNSR